MRKKSEKVVKNIEWPGAFDLINQARKLLKVNIWNVLTIFVGYFFVYLIIGQLTSKYAVVNRVVKLPKHQTAMVADVKSYPALILFLVVMLLAYSLLYLLVFYYSFKNAEAKSVEIVDAFKDSKKYYVRFALITFIGLGALFASLILVSLFVSVLSSITTPGIGALVALIVLALGAYFVIPRFVLVYSLVLKENMSIVQAIKSSWTLTSNYLNKIQLYIAACFMWAIGAFFLAMTIVGIPFAIYIMMFLMSSPALVYNEIKSNE